MNWPIGRPETRAKFFCVAAAGGTRDSSSLITRDFMMVTVTFPLPQPLATIDRDRSMNQFHLAKAESWDSEEGKEAIPGGAGAGGGG